ncbi:MAG: hypothetical protein WBO46_00875 [Caldilineaceae bacterium]
MIVLDENIHDARILGSVRRWYRGQVISIVELRPQTIIKDDAISGLLLQVQSPTFVTINVVDFWRKISPHPRYCIVTLALPQQMALQIPELLRRLLRQDSFRTKAQRMGYIFRVTPENFAYYTHNLSITDQNW